MVNTALLYLFGGLMAMTAGTVIVGHIEKTFERATASFQVIHVEEGARNDRFQING